MEQGNFVHPIVTEEMYVDSSSFHEEFFGPVFNLFRGGSAEECLKLANHSDYGLAGTIFTKDVAKA